VSLVNKSILIIDADRDSAHSLKRVLEKFQSPTKVGFDITIIPDPQEARARALSRNFDLLIIDILLPGLSGFDLCESIRSSDRGKNVPIVMTNGAYKISALPANLKETYQILHIFHKPFRFDHLVEEVYRAMNLDKVSLRNEDFEKREGNLDHGTLEKTPFHDLILHHYWMRTTGCIQITNENIRKKVFLLKGIPVHSDSDLRSENLGSFLVREQRIRSDQLQTAIDFAVQKEISLTQSLILQKIITQNQLFPLSKQLSIERIVNTFSWKRGQFEMFSGFESMEHAPLFQNSLGEIYRKGLLLALGTDGIRLQMKKWENCVLKKSPYFSLGFEQLSFETELESLVFEHPDSREDLNIQLSLLVWHQFGMVHFLKKEGFVPTPTLEPPLPQRKPSAPQQVPIEGRDSLQNFLLSTYMDSRRKNYFEILEISPVSTLKEVKKAYYRLAKNFHPDRYRGKLQGEILRICEMIFGTIVNAYQVLSNEEGRKRYIEFEMPKINKENRARESHREDAVHGEALFLKGEEALKNSNFEEAREFFRQAFEKNPNEPQYRMLLSWLDYCTEKGDSEDSRQQCKNEVLECLQTDPNLARAHLYWGILLVDEGQINAGIDSLQKSIRLDPHLPVAMEALKITMDLSQPNNSWFSLSKALFSPDAKLSCWRDT
jgi:CheY-like chemotaxis protein